MCGIVGFWARDSLLDWNVMDMLFTEAEKRGQDGFGICIITHKNSDNYRRIYTRKWKESYSKIKHEVEGFYNLHAFQDSITLGICRAQPETEPITDEKNMQPIVYIDKKGNQFVLVHNGAISSHSYNEILFYKEDDFTTDIDSEAIIHAYRHYNYDIIKTMENGIAGGVAAILYDNRTEQLHIITTHSPLAEGYIKGVGYIIHSSYEAIDKIVSDYTSAKRDGMNVWEYWYHHPLNPHTVYSLDLDSGFLRIKEFEPKYDHPIWKKEKQLYKIEKPRTKILVSASGGIDSTSTLAILKKLNYDVTAVHFKYGHRGEKCEEWAIKNICDKLGIELKIFDLRDVYKQIDNFSMLTNEEVPITTCSTNTIRTTVAWTSGRNMVFATLLGAYAESLILRNGYDEVRIAAGWNSLSEEGSYPDNSQPFNDALQNLFKLGTLCGNRIKPFLGLSNLLKSEYWYLAYKLGFLDLFEYTISCDRPYWSEEEQRAYNCDGQCGSTNLSIWASKIAGVEDPREFYHYNDDYYKAYKPKGLVKREINVNDIIDRILDITDEDKKVLKSMIREAK